MNNQKIVITDLDGTLLRSDGSFSIFDRKTLIRLGANKVIRVIATGRSIYSARRVLPIEFPIDFLIFSSGLGILNWQTQKIIFKNSFTPEIIKEIRGIVDSYSVDYMIHEDLPNNHHFKYRQQEFPHPDFLRRLKIYQGFAKPLDDSEPLITATQFVLILDQDKDVYNELCKELKGKASVIRATSPLDHRSMWIEIFPKNVSKGETVKWFANSNQIDLKNSLGIGNDYNDYDFLLITNNSFVVSNAPKELKQIFKVVSDNDSSGFTQAVNLGLNII